MEEMTTPTQYTALKIAAEPLLRYLAENHHPHVTVIVTCTSAELLEGVMSVQTTEYIRD